LDPYDLFSEVDIKLIELVSKQPTLRELHLRDSSLYESLGAMRTLTAITTLQKLVIEWPSAEFVRIIVQQWAKNLTGLTEFYMDVSE